MKNETPVFNPLKKDLTVGWDLQGKNPRNFLLRAREITMVDTMYAKHVKRTLADAVFDVKGDYRQDRDMQMKEIMKEISPEV